MVKDSNCTKLPVTTVPLLPVAPRHWPQQDAVQYKGDRDTQKKAMIFCIQKKKNPKVGYNQLLRPSGFKTGLSMGEVEPT
jgi:hypothetical protein